MHAARYRLLVDDFYVPLAKFTDYSRAKIQKSRALSGKEPPVKKRV
jgi:hypothetical protein